MPDFIVTDQDNCYRRFTVEKEDDLPEAVRVDRNLPSTATLTVRADDKKVVYSFQDMNGKSLLEFTYREPTEKENSVMDAQQSPMFADPVLFDEFESVLEEFYEEDTEANPTDWTLAARWGELLSSSPQAHEQIRMEIMEHANGDHSLHTVCVRMLQLGLEIGYRLGSK